MSTNGRMRSWEYLDDPWRRLTWIVPTSVLLWAGMLVVFATLLKRIPPTPPEVPPADVHFVELPPAAAGGPAVPAHHPAPARPKPRVIPPRPHHYVRVRRTPAPTRTIAKPAPKAPAPAVTSKPAPAAAGKESSTKRAATGTNEAKGGKVSGIGSGIGSDSGGARAIYAPKPVIPDDLRNQMIQTVAVAHFEVASDGKVQVSLTKPTDIPELNQILLDTLRQWRFFPAMKNGVAINSQFNVRIPISVQ
jgi:periplasmic protein TonB